jgi:Na+/H+-dicarboxylate symporter/ABC-type amino acid transport substrate-binding protein
MTLAAKVLVGLTAGVALGVFFGEEVAFLGILGRAFVLLLQMAVLPYVAVSLIAGLGSLTANRWQSLLRYAGGFLLVIWAIALASVLIAPIAFPDWPLASYFSSNLVEKREAFDFLGLYIPSNPFRALSDGVVPAVVVFSLTLGLALTGSPRKQPLLDALLGAQDGLRRLTGAVVELAPYGIFAIAAEAAGTIAPDRLAGLQVYVVTYVALSLLMTFGVLPALVAAVTPLSYRDVLDRGRDALVTAFATGSLFVVLPMIADRARSLLAERGADEEACRQVDVVVPIAFTLAGTGKLMGLVFVLYAGWQSGYPVTPSEMPTFAATGLFSSFAGSAVSLPFLLDLFRVPSDLFQLYLVVDSVVGNRFSALTGSVHALAISLLAGCGAAGMVRLDLRRLGVWAVVCLVAVTGSLGLVGAGFQLLLDPYSGYRAFIQRSFLMPTVPWRDRASLPDPVPRPSRDALQRIRDRGTLHVGYSPDKLPYAFRNEAGELVGFDIEMAHALARDLRVRVDFFRTDAARFPELLDSGVLDVAMTGLAITPERLERMALSTPVLYETLALIVRDHRRDEFRSREAIESLEDVHLAVPGRGYYATKVASFLPGARVTIVDSPRVFLRAEEGTFDALVFAAEAGSAWTLIYPEFTVAVPHPDLLRVPVGYATARDDRRLADFIDAWLVLKRSDRTIARLFGYWFEGKEPPGRSRRWSVAEDVLGIGAAAPETPDAPKPGSRPKEAAAPEPTPAPDAPAAQSPPAPEAAAPEPPPAPVAPAPRPPPPSDPPAPTAAPPPPQRSGFPAARASHSG